MGGKARMPSSSPEHPKQGVIFELASRDARVTA
jgi:hypothetical protein